MAGETIPTLASISPEDLLNGKPFINGDGQKKSLSSSGEIVLHISPNSPFMRPAADDERMPPTLPIMYDAQPMTPPVPDVTSEPSAQPKSHKLEVTHTVTFDGDDVEPHHLIAALHGSLSDYSAQYDGGAQTLGIGASFPPTNSPLRGSGEGAPTPVDLTPDVINKRRTKFRLGLKEGQVLWRLIAIPTAVFLVGGIVAGIETRNDGHAAGESCVTMGTAAVKAATFGIFDPAEFCTTGRFIGDMSPFSVLPNIGRLFGENK
jgi:hypothetical protein